MSLAEDAHLSRHQPKTPSFSLDGFYKYFRLEDCLKLLYSELGRLGISEYDLPPHQRALLSDLWRPLDEWAIGELHNYWDYDQAALLKRAKYQGRIPANPRIDIFIEITSRGNLKAEWFPRSLEDHDRGKPVTDFRIWRRADYRFAAFDSRPSNELFFLHGFQSVLHSLSDMSFRHDTRAVDQVLLAACAQVVVELKQRLEHHFEVRMLTDVFVTWETNDREDNQLWPNANRIVNWVIDDPAERTAAAERAELEELELRFGFSEALLVEVWRAEMTRGERRGPAPSPHTLMDRISRELKRRGKPATKGKVERAIHLIRLYRHAPE